MSYKEIKTTYLKKFKTFEKSQQRQESKSQHVIVEGSTIIHSHQKNHFYPKKLLNFQKKKVPGSNPTRDFFHGNLVPHSTSMPRTPQLGTNFFLPSTQEGREADMTT